MASVYVKITDDSEKDRRIDCWSNATIKTTDALENAGASNLGNVHYEMTLAQWSAKKLPLQDKAFKIAKITSGPAKADPSRPATQAQLDYMNKLGIRWGKEMKFTVATASFLIDSVKSGNGVQMFGVWED